MAQLPPSYELRGQIELSIRSAVVPQGWRTLRARGLQAPPIFWDLGRNWLSRANLGHFHAENGCLTPSTLYQPRKLKCRSATPVPYFKCT